jgi:hypothetical protein
VFAGTVLAQTSPPTAAVPASGDARQKNQMMKNTSPEWVARSNEDAQILLKVLSRFSPEYGSYLGVVGVDEQVVDLKPNLDERSRSAMRDAATQLREKLAAEKDEAVRQDLQIMIKTADDRIRGSELEQKYLLPYVDIAQLVFQGMRSLLDDQVAPERRAAAVVRLRRYAGMESGYEPVTHLAEQRIRERFGTPGVLGPYKGELEKDLGNNPTYIAGVAQLFEKYKIEGYQEAFSRVKQQLADYDAFVRKEVMERARVDFRLPNELYEHRLQVNGIPMKAAELAGIAHATFNEIQNEMMAVAPQVARQKGIIATDYRDVIRQLKKDQWEGKTILPNYEKRIAEVEDMIRRERLVTLPQRSLNIRLASEAESAAVPAPNMRPPQLLNNTGQTGIFVLPLRIPAPAGAKPGQSLQFDDFTFAAASWTLTAHEGRPGHELQFDSMVEKGISIARAVFSFNSTNVEGWGLYSEAILKPYMPLDGQLISLQHRLMRAARAFLDPELQAGQITPEQARHVLTDDVVLSDAMANQEVERYMFWAPGQAPTYFYGYTQLMRLRADAEKAMGDRFEQQRFHDFILSQGILPPPLMRNAVFQQFVPAVTSVAQKPAD